MTDEAGVPTESVNLEVHALLPTPPSIELVAAAFPQLEILDLIGQGGMGAVFKARQPKLNRLVALKILPQSLSDDPAFAERFEREGQLLARLSHPNVVTIHDFGQADGFFFLLMEFVDGVDLGKAMRAKRFTPAQALAIVPKICEALQYAHDEGVLHRDIKPANILLDTKGRVKLADFGIAKLAAEASAATNSADAPASAASLPGMLTQAGATLGTPQYMAPEQINCPAQVDFRADIYSLGVVFYELLTGELPVGRFPPPSQKSPVDSRVDEVVMHALEKEREHRQQSAGEMKTQVEAILANAAVVGTPPRRRPWVRNTVVAFVAFAIIIGLVRLFLVEPMKAETDSASPEIPRGSRFLVWKLASNFKPGDLISYKDGRQNLVGGVMSADEHTVVVYRRNDAPEIVSRTKIVGRLIGTSPIAVGSLKLIEATGHKSLAIARIDSLPGYPLHQVIVRFAGSELSDDQWRPARQEITGPILVPSLLARISGGGPAPVDNISLGTNSPSLASAVSYECPASFSLQFALPDEEIAREAASQMQKALAQPVRLVPGERIKLFAVGEREAWLETRRFQPLADKFAFFRHPGWSPVHTKIPPRIEYYAGQEPYRSRYSGGQIPGTNPVESYIATIPPDHELAITGTFVSNAVNQSQHGFSGTLASRPDQPGIYWFTWKTFPNLQSGNDGARKSGELYVHDATTGRELHRFRAPERLGIDWGRKGWHSEHLSLIHIPSPRDS